MQLYKVGGLCACVRVRVLELTTKVGCYQVIVIQLNLNLNKLLFQKSKSSVFTLLLLLNTELLMLLCAQKIELGMMDRHFTPSTNCLLAQKEQVQERWRAS